MGSLLVKIEMFILILIRISSLFVTSPLFGRRNLPTIFKIGFSFVVAILLVNVVEVPESISTFGMYEFAILAMKEFMIGVILGFVSYLVFAAIYLAGQLIDTQMGLGIVSVIDPASNIQVPVTANFYYTLAMVIFLTMNGHYILIEALVKSYSILPVGAAALTDSMMAHFVNIMAQMFIIGFKISAPVIAAILVCDVALGILARTMPQMNIFLVGLPLKILLGFVVIMITLPAFIMILNYMVDSINVQTTTMMKEMVPK